MMDLGSDILLLSPILLDLLLTSAWDRQKDFSKQGNGDYCGKHSNGVFGDKPSEKKSIKPSCDLSQLLWSECLAASFTLPRQQAAALCRSSDPVLEISQQQHCPLYSHSPGLSGSQILPAADTGTHIA